MYFNAKNEIMQTSQVFAQWVTYPAASKCFLFLMLHLMLDGLILFRKSDIH